ILTSDKQTIHPIQTIIFSHPMLSIPSLLARIRALPDYRLWPQLESLLKPPDKKQRFFWDYTEDACMAFGGTPQAGLDGAAAIYCLTLSVRLIDDLLDEEPTGLQHVHGIGRTANLAAAAQALACRLLEDSNDKPLPLLRALNRAALDTAHGQ